ncbi:hypothetical protein [Streptomyces abikoensis]|uniref:Uncharacterized protein n=1 Tax=Streptomyces abikoensis TaxID=97398 RepID=A0ABW7T4V2_9ACTN
MIVRLETLWHVDPDKWAEAAGMAPERCFPEFPWYLSDALAYIPMLDVTDARLRKHTIDYLPDQLDDIARFTMGFSIHVDANVWIRARAEGSGFRPNAEDSGYTAPVPAPHGRARSDLAQHIAEELFNKPMSIESQAAMAVVSPFKHVYVPDQRSARCGAWRQPLRRNGRIPGSSVPTLIAG